MRRLRLAHQNCQRVDVTSDCSATLQNRFHENAATTAKWVEHYLSLGNVMADERGGEGGIDCCNVWMNGVCGVLGLHPVEIQVMPILKPDRTRLNRQTRLKRSDFNIGNLSNGRQRHISDRDSSSTTKIWSASHFFNFLCTAHSHAVTFRRLNSPRRPANSDWPYSGQISLSTLAIVLGGRI